MSERPAVSIVVPLTGGRAQAGRCLEGIALAQSPPYEVIVLDNASVGLDSLLGSLEGDVQVLRSDRRLTTAGALALGLREARGEIAVLLRGAAAPLDGWLSPLAGALEDPTVGLAASVTVGEQATSPLSAWSVAMRAADLSRCSTPAQTPDELVIAALALPLAQAGLRIASIPESTLAAPSVRSGAGRRRPGEAPELTVVVPTLDATSARLQACIAAVQATTEAAHQVVIVDNGCPPQGFSAPVNAGLRAAVTPYVVVMNDDVVPQLGWWPPLRETLDAGASVCFPLTIDGFAREDFAGWCFAIAQESLRRFAHGPGEFFDPSMSVWFQDTDLLRRLHSAGDPPVLVRGSHIRHGLSETVASEDPQLRAWIHTQVQEDRKRFLEKHPNAVLAADSSIPSLKPAAVSAE